MEITCPNCGQTCEVDEEPMQGQHLLCPFCDVKFNYTPQNTTENDSYSIANTTETNVDAPTAKIQTTCPHCGAVYEVDAAYIGETATCETCENEFVVKEVEEAETPEAHSSDEPATTSGKGRFGAFHTKTRTVANIVKDKTVLLWERRWYGRTAIIGFAVLLAACLFAPLISHRSADADYEMGLRYLNGDGVDKDVVKATYLFRKAAEHGNADAQCQLGMFYGGLQDWKEAAKWYQAAAGQGHSKAKFGLGFCYIFGLGVSKDESKGTQLLNEAKQDPQLQSQIQELLNHFRFSDSNLPYSNVDGVAKDKPKSEESLRRAAELGNAEAQAALGLCYYNGEGAAKNEKEAMKWFRKAAEQGHANAQCLLGLGYESGTGVSMDKREAVKWLTKAAEQGQTKAQLELASLYLLGRDVERDYKQSLKWCRMAAEQGDVDAQYMYGGFYRNGLGVPVDMEEAARWYRKAAKQGYSRAQKALDEMDNAPQQHEIKKAKSRLILCCNLCNNALASESKSIAFLDHEPSGRCLKVRFTADPNKADATFCFGFFPGEDDILKLSYTYDSSRADVVYNVVDYTPDLLLYKHRAKTVVYIVKDTTTPVDMTLCITYDESVPDSIKIEEPNITSESNQQRTAIMYMLGFFK